MPGLYPEPGGRSTSHGISGLAIRRQSIKVDHPLDAALAHLAEGDLVAGDHDAVDLRADSPTFLRWHATELRADEPREIFIPEGFAHGFQALSEDAKVLYFHTAPWTPACEGGVRHDDPRLAIDWPLPVTDVSDRDRTHPLLDADFAGCPT